MSTGFDRFCRFCGVLKMLKWWKLWELRTEKEAGLQVSFSVLVSLWCGELANCPETSTQFLMIE